VRLQADDVTLEGDLTLPAGARGLVMFAHGSGSSRHSPRNRGVARYFNSRSLGTLLFDLLTSAEEQVDRVTAELRFDILLLAARVTGAARWVAARSDLRGLRLGLFGASTGSAAALIAASRLPGQVAAVVSRGGRPDLAMDALPQVQAPTLLIVGGEDQQVLDLNRLALRHLRCEATLVTVPRATHLFEEPGTLEEVARIAADWFEDHFQSPSTGRPMRDD
jgi:pimeloyl-ACP methyl ester carboxylesterase